MLVNFDCRRSLDFFQVCLIHMLQVSLLAHGVALVTLEKPLLNESRALTEI